MIISPNKPNNKEGLITKKESTSTQTQKETTIKDNQQAVINSRFTIKLVIYAIIILFSFILLGMFLSMLVVGSIVNKEQGLPKDFPISIPLYLPQQASIKTQNQIQRQKLNRIIESLPNWFITPFLSRLSIDLKSQVLLENKDETIYNATSLKKSIEASLENKLIISLKWKGLNKKREVLADYYIKKLQTSEFSIKTQNRQQETIIIFEKSKIKGIFLIADNFISEDSSNISLVVIY